VKRNLTTTQNEMLSTKKGQMNVFLVSGVALPTEQRAPLPQLVSGLTLTREGQKAEQGVGERNIRRPHWDTRLASQQDCSTV